MKRTLDGARVLLVEDEAMIAMNLEELCREHGADEVVTIDSFDALQPELIEAHRISSAILDIRISDQWTDTFARHLRERHIPFIFATGYASSHQVFEPFTGVHIVEKPYRESDLVDALADAILNTRSAESQP